MRTYSVAYVVGFTLSQATMALSLYYDARSEKHQILHTCLRTLTFLWLEQYTIFTYCIL